MKKITGFLFIFYILFTQSVNVYAQANLVQKNLDVPAIHSSVSKDASSNISRRIMTSLELDHNVTYTGKVTPPPTLNIHRVRNNRTYTGTVTLVDFDYDDKKNMTNALYHGTLYLTY